ncbi:DUF4194 domain-containing protein [Pseudomonas sp. S2_H01]|jgi:hypothetical protein
MTKKTEMVSFKKLCYGALFKYSAEEAAVWVKIGHNTVAGWKPEYVSDSWVGQPICSFAEDDQLDTDVFLITPTPTEDVRAVVDEPVAFQMRVRKWMIECFGVVIAADRQERNHRFLEEALELVQACNCGWDEAHQLVDYVYGRPVGEKAQEVGGVMVTLAALCLAQNLDMHEAAEAELARVWTKVEQIRAKQLAKPAIGPLPGAYPDRHQQRPVSPQCSEHLRTQGKLLPHHTLLPHPPRHWGFLQPEREVPGYTLDQMKEYGAKCAAEALRQNK